MDNDDIKALLTSALGSLLNFSDDVTDVVNVDICLIGIGLEDKATIEELESTPGNRKLNVESVKLMTV